MSGPLAGVRHARVWTRVAAGRGHREPAEVVCPAAGVSGPFLGRQVTVLKLGPVIGARTWGGVVGIDGGHGLVDGTRVTVPRYAFWFSQFGWDVENYGVDPDTEVLITPEDWAADRDPQLEVAVDRALALLAENPPAPLPDPSAGPAKPRPPLPPR